MCLCTEKLHQNTLKIYFFISIVNEPEAWTGKLRWRCRINDRWSHWLIKSLSPFSTGISKSGQQRHVVRRFRWVFALAWGQDRIVIAFLQKWLQFMSTYSKHNQTISSRGKRRHAWSLFLNKCCKRWWFIAWQSQTLIIQSHVIDLRQYTEWVISLYQYLHFWLEGQDDQVAVKSQPVLSDSETFSEVDGDTQPLNIIKK